jgi:polyvinyl alcohol dehydrogenase (cytochrome)
VDGNQLIIGDILNSQKVHNGANVIALDRETGTLRWMTQVESHPAAIITGSPVVFDGVVYIGVSSTEESLARNPAYPCCSFRGSIVALDAKSGAILWKTFDMPDNGGRTGGYSGGAVWQPPAIDPKRGTLFIGTGNNYTAPADVEACQNTTPTANCAADDDFFDTALALDLKTGQIKWAKRLEGVDTWTVACHLPPGTNPNCPVPGSQDFDFGGAGPNLVGDFVGFGQKSGIYWALDRDNGDIIWSTPVGPGGSLGGIEWGTATDGRRIYVAIANNGHLPYTLAPSGQQITWGSWSALDVATGKILWQTADPTVGTIDTGSVSVANGVMYAGSYSGQMYALDTRTGRILWNFASGGSVIDGPSIVDGVVYWGSGYRSIRPGIGNNKVYAFTLAGEKDRGERSDDDDKHSDDPGEQK